MVCTGSQVLVEPGGDRRRSAVGDESVDQCVAAGLGDIGVGETESAPVVGVVRQVQVDLQRLAADGPGALRVGGEHRFVLGCEKRVGADQLARAGGGFGGGQVGMRAGAAAGGEFQDLWAEGGDNARVFRHAVSVEFVEVFDEGVV